MRSDLRLVILFNMRDQSFTVVEHNLSVEDANAEVSRLRNDRLPAFHLAQPGEHSGAEAEACRACSEAVRRATRRLASDEEPETDPPTPTPAPARPVPADAPTARPAQPSVIRRRGLKVAAHLSRPVGR